MNSDGVVKIVLILSIIVLAFLLIQQNYGKSKEKFTMGAPIDSTEACSAPPIPMPDDTTDMSYKQVNFESNQVPKSCYPQDQLGPQDLLPGAGSAATAWAQANPMGQGDLDNMNFLSAGYHVGQNTVGQTKRNPNLSIRTEIPNPRVPVSPWNQSTIEPDLNRKTLDGEC
jgi:hypothetical protein